MSAAATLVRQMTLRRWLSASPDEKAVVTDALHDLVPSTLTLASIVGHHATPVPFFVHEPTQLGFYLLFGDRFMLGEAAETHVRALAAEAAADPDAEYLPLYDLTGQLALIRPRHEVEVAPFFLAEVAIAGPWRARFDLATVRGHEPFNRLALERITHHGWRLPAEAELELARLLPEDLRALANGWCRDSWHPNYVGAPTDGRPWGTDAALEVDGLRRDFDLTRAHAQLRPAFSLFAEP